MSRSRTHEATVLHIRPLGESNREAVFLTADMGLLRATVYGGAKSKLRAHVTSCHSGLLYAYHDPVRKSCKVTDFDVRDWRPSLRESLDRSLASSAICETVLASQGSGEWEQALGILNDALDALALADDSAAPRLVSSFFWSWSQILGSRPEMEICADCACSLPADEVVWYDEASGCLLCQRCAAGGGHGSLLELSALIRRYLATVDQYPLCRMLRSVLDAGSLSQLRRLGLSLMSSALGRRLKSWSLLV